MRLLLDQGLPRTTASLQRNAFATAEGSFEAQHVGDVGLASADDEAILAYALERRLVVVTMDADFHALLAQSGAAGPSVIRVRIEGLKAQPLAALLARVIERCRDDLESGAMITVTESSVRVRCLPLARPYL